MSELPWRFFGHSIQASGPACHAPVCTLATISLVARQQALGVTKSSFVSWHSRVADLTPVSGKPGLTGAEMIR